MTTTKALTAAVQSHARRGAKSRRAIAAAIARGRRELPPAEFKAWLRSTFRGIARN